MPPVEKNSSAIPLIGCRAKYGGENKKTFNRAALLLHKGKT